MALDIIGHINTEITTLTVEQKTAMLDDLSASLGYLDVIDGEPNPQTKKQFANEWIKRKIKEQVDYYRRREAEKTTSFEQLVLE